MTRRAGAGRSGVSRAVSRHNGDGEANGADRPPRRGRKANTRPSPLTWSDAYCEATATGWFVCLPTPERTNAIWRQWKGRTLVSAKHRADKREAPKRFGIAEPYRQDVAVRLVWVRHRRVGDVDSRVKAALDLLTAIGMWEDDSQVVELHVIRSDDADKAPGLYCWIWPADEPKREAA